MQINGFIIVGETYNAITDVTWIIKINGCGDTLWTKQYTLSPGSGGERPGNILQLDDSSFSIFGSHRDFSETGASSFLFRVSPNGDSVGHKIVNVGINDWGITALKADNGGYVGTGFFNLLAPDGLAFLVKTDSLGNIEWQQTYGYPYFNEVVSLDKTTDGGYIIGGNSSNHDNQSYDFFLLKTDILGNQQWRKMYGNAKWEGHGYAIAARDGGYLIVGDREMIFEDDYRGYIVKTDSAGEIEWEKLYGDSLISLMLFHATQLSDGNYIVAGSRNDTATANKNPKVYLIKISQQGNMLWERNYSYYGGSTSDAINDLKVTSEGDFVMTGSVLPIDMGLVTGRDMFVLKTDSCGYTVGDTTIAQFSITDTNGALITLSNESQTYCSSYWLFGDGDSSWLHNPTHAYEDTGTYTITLITRAGNTIDTFQQEVRIASLVGVSEMDEQQQIRVYPNPANETLYISLLNPLYAIQNIFITDISGKEILQTTQSELSVAHLASGLYFVRAELTNGESVVRKVIIQ